jgi:hypothetical protein
MFNEKNSVDVELYSLEQDDKNGDYTGRVVHTELLKEADLIRLAADRLHDLSPEALQVALDVLREVAVEKLIGGASVGLGLGFFYLDVEGVFTASHAKWNPSKHNLKVQAAPSADLQNLVRDMQGNVQGMASNPVIHTILDATTGKANTHLTGNGSVTITGSRIKIAGDHAVSGVTLAYANKAGFFRIPSTDVQLNEPSKVTFTVPPLPAGAYKLSITTQYCSESRLHKEPRTCTFYYPLTLL